MKISRGIEYDISAKDRASKVFDSVEKKLGNVTKTVGVFSAAVGTAGIAAAAGLAVVTTRAMENIDALAKTSDKLGVTTQALGGLRHAAELTGVSQQTLDMALQRMTRRLAEAAQGSGEAKGAIQELGLDAQKLAAMSPDRAMQEIAEAMGKVGTQSDKVRLAFKLFDSEGVSLVNTLGLGKEGLQAAAQEAEALGIAVSRIDAAKIEAANDAIYRARQAFTGVGQTISIELAPYIEAVATEISNAAKETNGFRSEIGTAMSIGIDGVQKLAYAFTGLNVVWSTLEYGFYAFQETVWEGLHGIRNAVTAVIESVNVGGLFDDELQESLRIQAEQEIILKQVRQNKEDALRAGANALTLHDQIQTKLDNYRQSILSASEAAATGVASKSPGGAPSFGGGSSSAGGGSAPGGSGGSKTDPLAAYGEELARRVDSLQESLMSEEEMINSSYWKRFSTIEEASMEGIISEQQRSEMMKQIYLDRETALTDLVQGEERKRAELRTLIAQSTADSLLSIGASLQTLSADQSRSMFEASKVASIAGTVVSTYEGAQNAYTAMAKIPVVGPALGAAAAAAAIVAGMARVKAIESTSFGSKGSSSISAGSGASHGNFSGGGPPVVTQPTLAENARPLQLTVHIAGNVIGEEAWVEDTLAPQIKNAVSRSIDFGFETKRN